MIKSQEKGERHYIYFYLVLENIFKRSLTTIYLQWKLKENWLKFKCECKKRVWPPSVIMIMLVIINPWLGWRAARCQHAGAEEDAEHQRRLRESPPAHPHPALREEAQQGRHPQAHHRVGERPSCTIECVLIITCCQVYKLPCLCPGHGQAAQRALQGLQQKSCGSQQQR